MASLRDNLASLKDGAVAMGLTHLLRKQLQDYARDLDLRVDSKRKSISIELHLKGESVPIHIHVDGYHLSETGEKTFITPGSISCTREWVNTLLQRKVAGKPFEIPETYASVAKKIL